MLIIRLAAKPPRRFRPLSSNVRHRIFHRRFVRNTDKLKCTCLNVQMSKQQINQTGREK